MYAFLELQGKICAMSCILELLHIGITTVASIRVGDDRVLSVKVKRRRLIPGEYRYLNLDKMMH